jgi:hypothetical protein
MNHPNVVNRFAYTGTDNPRAGEAQLFRSATGPARTFFRIINGSDQTIYAVVGDPEKTDWSALDAWADVTGYLIGDKVLADSVAYRCIHNHTSVAGVLGNEPEVGVDWEDEWELIEGGYATYASSSFFIMAIAAGAQRQRYLRGNTIIFDTIGIFIPSTASNTDKIQVWGS